MIEEILKELDKNEERTLNKVEFNKFKQLVDMVVEYGTLTNTESYILKDALNKIVLRRKKAIKERTEKDLEVLEKELEKQLGKEGLKEIKTAFEKIEGEITKTIKNKIEKDKEKIKEKIIEEENLSTFIATFGAGQENEGKYFKIYCEGYDVAVSYMEKKYHENYSMIYNNEQWEKYLKLAKENKIEIEECMNEIFILRNN